MIFNYRVDDHQCFSIRPLAIYRDMSICCLKMGAHAPVDADALAFFTATTSFQRYFLPARFRLLPLRSADAAHFGKPMLDWRDAR